MMPLRPIAFAAATLCLLQGCATPPSQTAASKAMQIEPVLRVEHSGKKTALTYYQLGKFHQEHGNLDAARASYLQSIALDAHQADARNALAVIHAKQGRLDDAAKLLQDLVRDYPKDAYLQNNLAYVHYLRHDYSAALGSLERALNIEPGNARAHANLDLVQTALVEKRNTLIAGDATTAAQAQLDTANGGAAQPVTRRPAVPPQEEKAAAMAIAEAREAILAPAAVESRRKPVMPVPQALPQIPAVATPDRPVYSSSMQGLQVVQLQPNVIELRPHAAVPSLNNAKPVEAHALRTAPDTASASAATATVAPPAPSVTAKQQSAPKAFRVDIANGNGIAGMAAKMRKALEQKGIPVARLSNRKPFDTAATEIQYRAGFLHEAEHVRSAMQAPVVLSAVKNMPANADVRLLLGKDAGGHLALLHGDTRLAMNDKHK
jgi:tetratricopeptide (TPR) repeat protein